MRKLTVFIVVLLFEFNALGQSLGENPSDPNLPSESTVVVCEPQDAYYPLALEISQSEGIPLVAGIGQALAAKPRFVLWIGSPNYFTDAVLSGSALALKSMGSISSVGIISGFSLADARALWQRGSAAGGARVNAVVGRNPPMQLFRGAVLRSAGFSGVAPDKSEFQELLVKSDYLSFFGRGDGAVWQIEGIGFRPDDLPQLPPLVLATSGFASFLLNSGSSMAMTAAKRGAAAYTGSLIEPYEGYMMSEAGGLPFQYTWPGLTIGEVIQIQNHSAMQAFASRPWYFLLGDPRISLQPLPIATILRIETVRGVRSIQYGDMPPGIFPLRIKDGARYHYVEIPEATAASDYDFFYNSRLQMVNVGSDKLVLVSHTGGELTLGLRPEPQSFWRLKQTLIHSLDHTMIYLPQSEGSLASFFLAALALFGIIYLMKQGEMPAKILLPSSLAGIVMGLGHMTFVSDRINLTTVASKPIVVGAPDVIATALAASCGVILFLGSDSVARKIAGILVAVLPTLSAALFTFFKIFAANILYTRSALGAGIYNYSMVAISLIGMVCQAAAFMMVIVLLRRPWRARRAGK